MHSGERAEDAIVRELLEETGLHARVVRWLFSIPYRLGSSTTFLVEIETGAEVQLGIDPEEVGMEHRKLVGVAWRPVGEVQESPEVRMMEIVLSYLDRL
jgi:8-oxo-dGTP pyrophosphatase MutT (NUDIX family)